MTRPADRLPWHRSTWPPWVVALVIVALLRTSESAVTSQQRLQAPIG